MSDAKVTFEDENWDKTQDPAKACFFSFACPKHRGRTCDTLPIRGRTTGGGASWQWDGNLAAPTFSPSIDHKGCWHGYIEKGRCVTVQKADELEPTA